MTPMLLILAFVWPISLEYLRGWQAMVLFAALALPVVWLGKRSLNGLGPVRKWVAIGLRIAVLGLMILILGGVRWQRENKTVEVIVLRDISESTQNVQDFPDKTLTTSIERFLNAASENKRKKPDDRIGVVSFSNSALIDAIPNTKLALDTRAIRSAGSGTDIASAIQLALATMGNDAMHRLVLMSDGNATLGDLDAALSAAAAQNVPIDVMPLKYDVQNEVLVDRFVAPAWKRENEPFTIDVILRSTNALDTVGKLTVLHQDKPMDLDPAAPGPQQSMAVTLKPGRNVIRIPVPPLPDAGVHQFRAMFEGENVAAAIAGQKPGSPGNLNKSGDTLLQNNAADAFTFVRGKGKILYIDNVPGGNGANLRQALTNEGIAVDATISRVDGFPRNLVEMQNYDAVILANVPRGAGGLDEDQSKMLASYVHDLGGGLVMIGGEDAFGAGGWNGSKLEEVLPVSMDIPAQRQMPKGALVLVVHSCEFPEGNYWGEQCALKAIDVLTARDEIGVISYDWSKGSAQWDYPLAEKGDGKKVTSAVKNMKVGDMPDFNDTLDLALWGVNGVGGLANSDARQKHVIIISDGDPQTPNPKLMQDYVTAQVSVSTVSVYPHDKSDQGLPPTMRQIAATLKGRAYGPVNNNFNQLPQIFIKEATVVRRSLILEEKKGIPLKLPASGSDILKGLGETPPPVFGMVLTGKKPNPQIEYPIVAGNNNDPVLAHWQTGLGKAAVFTSDAHNKWAANWIGSPAYEKFWAQVVRSVSRPPMSADFDVQITQSGDKGKINVEALGKDSAFLNFLSVGGTIVGPDMKPVTVRLTQTGPGAYSGEFDAQQPGNYVAVMNYRGGAQGQSGVLLSGMAVNSSPELRDLKSNDTTLRQVADRTRGRFLDKPFDVDSADLFRREGLTATASPRPVWDLLLPYLIGLILLDVACRRIAWDWNSLKRMAVTAADGIKSRTTTRKVETRQTLDALAGVRARSAEGSAAPAQSKRDPAGQVAAGQVAPPDRSAKFEAPKGAGASDVDLSKAVGGAVDKPVPSAPKNPEPKGLTGDKADAMGGLMAAKKRAQQKIKEQEAGES